MASRKTLASRRNKGTTSGRGGAAQAGEGAARARSAPMPINYLEQETKYGAERRNGKSAAKLYEEHAGYLPVEDFVDAGYGADDLAPFFERETILEAALRPRTSRPGGDRARWF